MATTVTTSTMLVIAAKPKSSDFGADDANPTTAKIRAASMTTRGGPRRVISGIARRQPRPAPTRSEKYMRPMPSPARPRSTATMIPNAMNVAKIAKQMTPSRNRLVNDARDP